MKKYIATNRFPDATHLKIEVRYEKGGYNYFTYKEDPRGVYVSISPVTLEGRPGGYQMELYTVKFCAKELKRKSDKAVQEVAAKLEPKAEQIARAWEDRGPSGVANFIRETLS